MSSNAIELLKALRERYRASSGNIVSALDGHAERLAHAPDSPEVIEAVRRELHRVHGTAGSYGFGEASNLAGAMEERAIRWASDASADRGERAAMLRRLARALERSFRVPDEAPPEESGAGRTRRLALSGITPEVAGRLTTEATMRGYEVLTLEAGGWTPRTLRELMPDALLVMASDPAPITRAAEEAHVPVLVVESLADAGRILDAVARIAARGSLAGARVVVVDDDASMLSAIEAAVAPLGLRVTLMQGPGQLAETLRRLHPALLMMDIEMGSHDGLAEAEAIRGEPDFSALPIMLVSSRVDADTRARAYRIGVDELVPKPLVPTELRQRVAERLEGRRLRRIADGLHPGTGLPLTERFSSEAGELLASAAAGHGGASLALIRALGTVAGGLPVEGWWDEVARIAGALGGTAGLYDETTLAVAASGEAAALVERLGALLESQPPEAPAWRAGVVGTVEALRADVATLAELAGSVLESAGGEQPVREWKAADSVAAPQVIVVEDDVALAEMMAFALRAGGYTYRVYHNGAEALDALMAMDTHGRRPLVILDADLPGLDGHSLHEQLRVQRPGTYDVVFASVHSGESEQLRALRSGAVDYIVKPMSLRLLLAKIPNWLARQDRAG